MFDVYAIKSEEKNCSIDRFNIQFNTNKEINSSIIERINCRFKPLTGNEFKKLSNFLEADLKKLINFSNTEFQKDFFNSSCQNEKCFVFMPSSPLYTELWGNKRRCWFRINREICPFISHPSDLQIFVDFSSFKVENWEILSIWYKTQIYKFKEFILNLPNKYGSSNLFNSNDNKQPNIAKCNKINSNKNGLVIENGIIKYRKWRFSYLYSDIIGIKLVDIRFENMKIAFEISLEEIVTSYCGFSPFIKTMTSIESMYRIGDFISELSPGVDCPENAQFFPVIKFLKNSNIPHKVKRAVCVFSRKSTKPLGRHFEFQGNGRNMKFASAFPNYLLYFRYIITLYNYDYIFDYIFHDSGAIDIAVTPTGYIHVDSYETNNISLNPYLSKFGYVYPRLNLNFPIHQHMFFFKIDLDIIEKENTFHVIDIIKDETKPMGENIWMNNRIIKWENNSVFKYDFDNPKIFLICQDKFGNSKCIRIINKSPFPNLLSEKYFKSINWKRFHLAVTKRRSNETSGSSMFNGVNLLDSVVNFQKILSNNDFLNNQDLVVWATIGSMHIPTIEDTPITITSSNEMKITLKPFNLFDESPQTANEDEIFTRNASLGFEFIYNIL